MLLLTGPTTARIRRRGAGFRYVKMGPSRGPPPVRAENDPTFRTQRLCETARLVRSARTGRSLRLYTGIQRC